LIAVVQDTTNISFSDFTFKSWGWWFSNWKGSKAQDSGAFYKSDLIGIVQEVNLTNVNSNQVFILAPPILG
jgi:hypothetical protein